MNNFSSTLLTVLLHDFHPQIVNDPPRKRCFNDKTRYYFLTSSPLNISFCTFCLSRVELLLVAENYFRQIQKITRAHAFFELFEMLSPRLEQQYACVFHVFSRKKNELLLFSRAKRSLFAQGYVKMISFFSRPRQPSAFHL